MYIISIKALKSINGAKFHPIISTAKYILIGLNNNHGLDKYYLN